MCAGCACGGSGEASGEVKPGEAKVYSVSGMTCGHCVSSICGEIGKIEGVTGVVVDLPTGAVTVSGTGFSEQEVRSAVERAGYVLVGGV